MFATDYAAYLHVKTDNVDKQHRLPNTICAEGTSLAQAIAKSLQESLLKEENNFATAISNQCRLIAWGDLTLEELWHETCPMLSHLVDQHKQDELISNMSGELVQSWADKDLSSLSEQDKEVSVSMNDQVKIVLVRHF